MSKEVVRVKVECSVIVRHCSAEVVLVESRQGAVDIMVGTLWLEVYCLVEVFLSVLPLLA